MGTVKKNTTKKSVSAPQKSDFLMVVTILLSVSGWGFVYLLNLITAAPVIEYDVNWEMQRNQRAVAINVENLSHTDKIGPLVLGVGSRKPSPNRFLDPRLEAIAPAAEGQGSRAEIVHGGIEVHFTIQQIHPHQQFRMRAKYDGNDNPELRLVSAEKSVYLYKKGLITWFAKNLIYVVFTITILTLLSVLIFAIAPRLMSLARRTKANKTDSA